MLAAWRETFDCGHDFFGDLEPLGIVDPVDVFPLNAREMARVTFMAAAVDAWKQVGAVYMSGWRPNGAREKPWALEQFGEPHAG